MLLVCELKYVFSRRGRSIMASTSTNAEFVPKCSRLRNVSVFTDTKFTQGSYKSGLGNVRLSGHILPVKHLTVVLELSVEFFKLRIDLETHLTSI